MLALPVCTDVFSNGRNVCERAKDDETLYTASSQMHRCLGNWYWFQSNRCEQLNTCYEMRETLILFICPRGANQKETRNSKWLSPRARALAPRNIHSSQGEKILHTKNNPFNLHRARKSIWFICVFIRRCRWIMHQQLFAKYARFSLPPFVMHCRIVRIAS